MNSQDVDYLKGLSIPVYVYGAGEIATYARKALLKNGIPVKGLIDYKQSDLTNSIYTKEQVLQCETDYVLVKGYLGAYFISDEKIMEAWPGCRKVITLTDVYETESISQKFYDEHLEYFDKVRSNLSDELSVRSFDAFIMSKLTLTNIDIMKVIERKQYFFDNPPWLYSDDDILVDGGAFIGDSIMDFVKLRHNAYKKIIAFEPDKGNFDLLLKNVEELNLKNVEAYNCGLHSEKTVLSFSASGDMMSAFTSDGDIQLQVDSIDNVIKDENVSIIKMDIEGSEMDALQGAEQTIARCRPIMMISAYHKKDDLYNIFDFINSKVDNYSFYFRCHKPMPIDAVLYAVPNERVLR
jgi:FkbM family methyltransferase